MNNMKKYKVQCKTIEIKTDLAKPSWQANILIDGESLFENGRGISKVIYEGKSPELPQLFIEGNPELMTEFIKERLTPVEESRLVITIDVEVEPPIEGAKGLHDSIINIVRKEIKNTLQNNIEITMQSCDKSLNSLEGVAKNIAQSIRAKNINL